MDLQMLDISINGRPLPEGGEAELEAADLREWAQVELALAPVAGAVDARLTLGAEALGAPVTTPFDPRWRWRWQPGGIAGMVEGELVVTLGSGAELRRGLRLRLRPRAIDRETYAALLREIQREARALALRLGGQAFERAALLPVDESSRSLLEEALALAQRHGRMLSKSVGELAGRPRSTLRPTRVRRRLAESGDLSQVDFKELVRGPFEPAARADGEEPEQQGETLAALRLATGGQLPPELALQQSASSFDTPEHRFALWLVREVARRARVVRELASAALALEPERGASRAPRTQLLGLRERASAIVREMDQLGALPLLAGLSPLAQPPQSQALRRDRRYRPLLSLWRELRAAPLLTLDLPLLHLPIAALPALYEGWCALTVCRALLELGQPEAQRLLAPTDHGWALRLQREQPLLELQAGPANLQLCYQPRYMPHAGAGPEVGSLDRYLRIPDLSIEVRQGDQLWLIVLDAKYRLAPDGHIPQDALDDVYAYHGSLGRHGQPCVRYAAVLYPGRLPAERYGEIGALSFLPGQAEAVASLLAELLEQPLGAAD